MKAKPYNGHPSYAHWNVSLWFGSDEDLYRMARSAKSGAELFIMCQEAGYLKTADGVKATKTLATYAWKAWKD